MSLAYRAVDWNRQKRRYDFTRSGLVLLLLGTFCAVSLWVSPNVTVETLVLRGTSLTATFPVRASTCPRGRLVRVGVEGSDGRAIVILLAGADPAPLRFEVQ